MKLMKRGMGILLCLGLICSVLGGCGKNATSKGSEPSAPVETAAPTAPAAQPSPSTDSTQGPAAGGDPSKPWRLEDWVQTGFQKEIRWTDDMGTQISVTINLPSITPAADFAVEYNQKISAYQDALVQEITECQESLSWTDLVSVSYEAYLHDDILSILRMEQTNIDLTYYTADSFDLDDGEALTASDLCDEFLDLDYPAFLMVANGMIQREFEATYGQIYDVDSAEADDAQQEGLEFYRQVYDSIATDAAGLLGRQLYVGENGQLMMIYDAPSLAGAGYYPTVMPLSRSEITYIPSQEESYRYLFGLWDAAGEADVEACGALLTMAFDEDPEDFAQELDKCAGDLIDKTVKQVASGYASNPNRLAALCDEVEVSAIRDALLAELAALR